MRCVPGCHGHGRILTRMEPNLTPDPRETVRALYAENLRLRELLVAVAQELERMASEDREVQGRDRLLRRAMRIRERMHR